MNEWMYQECVSRWKKYRKTDKQRLVEDIFSMMCVNNNNNNKNFYNSKYPEAIMMIMMIDHRSNIYVQSYCVCVCVSKGWSRRKNNNNIDRSIEYRFFRFVKKNE